MAKEQNKVWMRMEVGNVILYLTSRFLSNFGRELFNFALSLYILSVSGSGASFAVSLVVGTLPKLLFSVHAGIFSDRFGKRKVIIFSDIIAGIFMAILFGIMKFDNISVWGLYFINFLLGACNAIFNVAMNGAIPNITDKDKLTSINSWTLLISSLAEILGTIVGGLFFSTNLFYLFVLVNVFCYFGAAFVELFIKFSFNIHGNNNCGHYEKSSMKDVAIFLKENRGIAIVIAFSSILNFFLAFGYSVPMPYIVNNYLHMSSAQYGFLRTANTSGALLCAFIQPLFPEKEHLHNKFLGGVGSIGVIFLLFSIISSSAITENNTAKFNAFVILFMSFAFILVLINVPLKVALQKYIPNNLRGKSMGLMYSVMAAATPLGQISAGFLIDKIKPYYFPAFAGGLIFICYIFMMKTEELKGV